MSVTGDIPEKNVWCLLDRICLGRGRVFTEIFLQYIGGRDLQALVPKRAETKLLSDHGIRDGIDVELGTDVLSVGMGLSFNDVDVTCEAVIDEPLSEGRRDLNGHGDRRVVC